MNKSKGKRKSNIRKNSDRVNRNSTKEQFDKSSAEEKKGQPTNPFNDVSWYTRNPSLTVAASQIPYPYRPGMQLPVMSIAGTNKYYNIPGIMAIKYAICAGRSDNVTDPASIISKEMYGKIRSAFSGGIVADPPDLFIYMMAMDSIYNQIAEMKRLFRAIGQYFPENYCVPEGLIGALTGLAGNDAAVNALIDDKMLFFQQINELVGMVQKFRVPSIMKVMDRHYWLGDYVYTDANALNSQWYVFVNTTHYKFALDAEGKGQLTPVSFVYKTTESASYTTQWYQHVRGLIEALANSEDAYTISGYFERAYSDTPMFMVAPLLYNEQNIPQYVPEVLAQIENSWVLGVPTSTLTVTQEPSSNAIITTPTVPTTWTKDLILHNQLSIRNPVPTIFDTIIASRMQPATDGLAVWPATEVPTGYEIHLAGTFVVRNQTFSPTITPAGDDFAFIAAASRFDWSPFFYQYSPADTVNLVNQVGDIHNVTSFSHKQMRELNRVCLYSEFGAFSGI